MDYQLTHWLGFLLLVGGMLALDLGVFNRGSKDLSFRGAVVWSGVWITLALLFNLGIWKWQGLRPAMEFFAGYIIEKSLSVDNIFVFLVLFSYFGVEHRYQHKVLFYGILGAVLMRGFFIFLGVELVSRFHWILLLFGVLLVYTGIKLLRQDTEETVDPEKNPVFRFFRRFVPSVSEYRGGRFFVRENGTWLATPLFFVLVAVETTDLVFATDSIPAIFAITRDPFIIFSSNILAILGLRALYFVLATAMRKLEYLKLGLSIILIFIGGKMLIGEWYEIPIDISLAVIVFVLSIAVIASNQKTRKEAEIVRLSSPKKSA